MANITTQTIRVDLNTSKTIPRAFTHQGDTARTLEFAIYNNCNPFDLTGSTVKFAYKSPNVNGQYSVITGASMATGTVTGNKVAVTLPVAYTKISGVGLLTMIITPTSGTVRPVNIMLVVQKSADGDDTILNASDWPEGLYEYMDNWLEENEPTEIANLKSDLDKVAEKTANLFDASYGVTQGYYSPSGTLNSETLVPSKDTAGSNAYYLYNVAIPVEGGKTYAFPLDYVGRLSTYSTATTDVDGVPHYRRSGYVPNTSMTQKDDCLLWTAGASIGFICFHFWKNTGSIQDYIDSFMIIKVDDASTFAFPSKYIPFGYELQVNVPVSNITDYDIVGKDAELLADINGKADKKIVNLFDNSVEYADGYSIGVTADIANMIPTGLVAKTNYKTALQLIPVNRGSKFVVSKDFIGEIGLYNWSGGRSKAISNTELSVGDNCLYYEINAESFPYEKYYIGIGFTVSSYVNYLDFVFAVDVDSLPQSSIDHSDYYLDECKVLASDVVGFAEFIKDQDSKFTFSEDEFNENYAARVQEFQKPNCLTITFKTDSHTDLNSSSISTEKSVTNALETGYIGDYLGQDVIVHGGDLLTTGYTDKTIPLHSLRGYLNRMYKFAKAPFLVAKGNHDDNCYDTRTTVNNYSVDALILPTEWNAIAMQYAKKYAVCPTIGNANYCYIDNERTKIRVFVLDTEDFDYHVSDGVAELNSGTTSAFSNEQLNFVANALLFADKDEPNEWAALFISHRPIDTTTTSRKRMGIGDALIRNHLIMLGIITAYKNGTRYTASGYGGKNAEEINSQYFPYNVDVDYTSKGAGEVIGFLFGHTHNCNTSNEVGNNSAALSYGFRYISCGSASFYTLVFNRDTKKINVLFYASDKSQVQLVSDSSEFGEIIGLTESDLNNFGDWETSWE